MSQIQNFGRCDFVLRPEAKYKRRKKHAFFIAAAIMTLCLLAVYAVTGFPRVYRIFSSLPAAISGSTPEPTPTPLKLSPRPTIIKGIYVTAGNARSARLKDLLGLVKRTELNAMVIDVKDSYSTTLDDYLRTLIIQLHKDNIYAIARIVVFQDHEFAKTHPDVALKLKNGQFWRDNKKTYWVDPSSKKVWDHIVAVAKKTIDLGFDEIQFDYVRFPSENVNTIVFPVYDGQMPKNQVIRAFWGYLKKNLKEYDPEVALSADLFAYNMIDSGDLNIGQRFRDAFGNFDAISPMIYPSHYSAGNFGFQNPAEHPYEVVYRTLMAGKAQIDAYAGTSTSVVIRPWFQDFDLGADYNAVMVRKQFQAAADAGFNRGWLLWNPSNVYTESALAR